MAGLITPNSGEIRINDTIINNENIRAIRNNIGIIFQNPDNQFVGLTVEDDIAFGLDNKKVPHTKMKQIINLAATATGITNLLEAEPASLSGGQKQRVAIAGVLATNPKIIIFDESTSMLDPNAKQDLKKLMLDLKNNYGKTIVSVTHDMEEVTSADKIIIMNKGKVLKIASPEEVFSDREFLLNIKLDVPFNLHLCMELQKLSKHKDDYPLTTDLHKLVKEI
jgi:energy-coupling factor transport system ATP-binding protein